MPTASVSSARCDAIAWITCSSGTTAKPSAYCANTHITTTGGHIGVSARNLRLVRNGFHRRSRCSTSPCTEYRFSVACTIATTRLLVRLRARDEVSAPDSRTSSRESFASVITSAAEARVVRVAVDASGVEDYYAKVNNGADE
jgi:hypothetical protein